MVDRKELLMSMKRRKFLGLLGGAVAASVFPGDFAAGASSTVGAQERRRPQPPPQLLGHRYLTFNSVVRVNQIEVTRDKNEGVDEADIHTPDTVRALRTAFADGFPGGRMTWALSWLALHDQRPNYKEIRRIIAGFHEQLGDDVTFIPGGYFAPMYNTREQVNRDIHEALGLLSTLMRGRFRPRSLLAGFLAAENLRYLAEQEDIHVCQGNIWSQYAIDNGDGDGSISYPYYPSRQHFLKPAQGAADFIDCVNLDGWTCDFLAARRAGFAEGFNSRLGVGPIETVRNLGPEKGVAEMLATTAAHYDAGFKLNGFAWVTDCWEVSLVKDFNHLECLTKWLSEVRRRWPDTVSLTQGDFGLRWREQFKDNDKIDYRFVQRGSGIGGSDADKEILWFMNKDFRLALLRKWESNEPAKVIDFTRYDLEAKEPGEMGRNWSLMNRLNQKETRPQDKPTPIERLAPEDRAIVARRYPELF
jgi:hypothetical protein